MLRYIQVVSKHLIRKSGAFDTHGLLVAPGWILFGSSDGIVEVPRSLFELLVYLLSSVVRIYEHDLP